MTDSEKLNVILSRLDKLDSLESEMKEVKQDIQGMKKDIRGLKDEMKEVKKEIRNVKKDVSTFKRQTVKAVDDLKVMDKLILDEVERVHAILDMHKADKTAHSA